MTLSNVLPRRRYSRLLSAAVTLAVAMPLSLVSAPAHADPVAGASDGTGISAFAKKLESKYVDPSRVYSTDVRWWLGEAAHTDETLLEEIQALYDSGFRGVELCMQADNAAPDADYAFGSEMWTHKWIDKSDGIVGESRTRCVACEAVVR